MGRPLHSSVVMYVVIVQFNKIPIENYIIMYENTYFLGRILVHEWGHYRWGLFDEYADPVGDPDNYQEFYYNYITGLWEGVR